MFKNPQLRDALLKVAEDPQRPGVIDRDRLERWLLKNENVVVNGMRFISTIRDGERYWRLEEMH